MKKRGIIFLGFIFFFFVAGVESVSAEKRTVSLPWIRLERWERGEKISDKTFYTLVSFEPGTLDVKETKNYAGDFAHIEVCTTIYSYSSEKVLENRK